MKLKDGGGGGVEGIWGESVIVIGSIQRRPCPVASIPWDLPPPRIQSIQVDTVHKGNSEEENNGRVVFKFNIQRSAGK